ncbi:MAG: response regulator [Gemmatimonadetes bacterium]|nr:response regulator [Gemmatimonadota bacterium]
MELFAHLVLIAAAPALLVLALALRRRAKASEALVRGLREQAAHTERLLAESEDRSGRATLLATGVLALLPAELHGLAEQSIRCAMEGGWPGGAVAPHATDQDGAVREADLASLAVPVWGELVAEAAARELAERRRAEEAVRRSEDWSRLLFSEIPEAAFVVDPETYRILDVNSVGEGLYGYSREELLEMTVLELYPEDDVAIARAAMARTPDQGFAREERSRHRRKDGALLPVDLHRARRRIGGLDILLVIVVDLSLKELLEAQVRQSQKMDALGLLAGGIAHDFNNLLTAISTNVSMALTALGPEHPEYAGLRDAEDAARHGAELTRRLLTFSRRGGSTPQAINLNSSVDETVRLLRRTIDPRISLESDEDPVLWPIRADPGQMSQVLMNLCINARDAMPEGGRLTIETRNVALDHAYCRTNAAARAGQFVRLTVSDTGCGMDAGTQERIFEPFFSTKQAGRGTGLGLSVVFGVVTQHHGWINAYSEPGLGTTFTIYLPRLLDGAAEEQAPAPEAEVRGGSEIILLADDDPAVRNVGRRVLTRYGYTVLEAADGDEALAVFARERRRIAAVVLDLTMPRKSGRDTLVELMRMDPELPVLLSSGYAADVAAGELLAAGARGFVSKPYEPRALARAVRQALDGS